jgi:LysR family transcriptional regulator, cell division regulator
MDADDLRVLEAVAKYGSMNRAAAGLNTVQSNVTARIRLLEEDLGVPLFRRHSRGVEPTEAGRRLIPYAARVRQLLQEANAAAREDGIPKGTLRLGTLETTAALRLPPVLAAYAQAYPTVGLVVNTGTTCDLLSSVIEHRLDGAFVTGPIRHADLIEEVMFREELVLVTARSVNAVSDLTAIRDLKVIVFRVGCSYRQRLETILREMGIQLAQAVEFGSLDAIIGCVAAGIGVTLLPKAVVTKAWQDGLVTVHALPTEQTQVDTVFIRRRDTYATSALTTFLAMTRQVSTTAMPIIHE